MSASSGADRSAQLAQQEESEHPGAATAAAEPSEPQALERDWNGAKTSAAAAAPPCSHEEQATPEAEAEAVSPWLRSTARLAWVGVLTGAGAGAALALSLSLPRAWEPLDVAMPLVLGVTVGVLASLPTTALCALTGLLVLARRPSQRRLATSWLCSWPTVTAGLGLAFFAAAGRYAWWYVVVVGVCLVAAVLASVLGSRRWVLSPVLSSV